MPKIEKQSPKPSTNGPQPKAGSVLDRIAPVKAVDTNRQKWAIYGVPKTGKTRFACTFKKPLLIIGAEDGTASVAGVKGIEFVQAQSLAEFDEVVREVRGGRWASVVVDTLSKLRDMRIVEIFAEMGMVGSAIPEKKPFIYADKVWKSVWTQCGQDLKNSMRILLDYPRLMDLNIVTISQEANLIYDDGTSAGSDLLRPSIGSAVGKSMCEWLHAECDYIGQMFVRRQTTKKNVGTPEAPIWMEEQSGKNEHCLRLCTDGIYQAGFRLPEGRVLGSEYLANPTYEKICALIRGK